MARYIDADKLVERLKVSPIFQDFGTDGYFIRDMVIDLVGCCSTADVVEVVRCKDCKHNVANWQHDNLNCTDYTDITCDYFMTDGMNGNDFCSYGERKEK